MLKQLPPSGESPGLWIERALALADLARGRTSPNPPVGAVVVRAGEIVGEGWTQPPGGPHAEVVALRAAGAATRDANLYVTLEPCTFWGRTPPCTDAIIQAGIRRVFFAARDPDQRIGAGAAAILSAAGVATTEQPEYAARVAEQIAAFRCWTTERRPLVIAKYAMTIDGKIATADGDSRWVSGAAARRRVHELRDQVDAILVGVGTVLADDPELTTRLSDHWRPVQHPLRVIVDSRGRTPITACALDPTLPGRTLIAVVDAPPAWRHEIEQRGAEVVALAPDAHGRVDLRLLLQLLATRNLTSVLAEGGAHVLGALATARLIDRLWTFVAPKLVGGSAAPGPIAGLGVARMDDAQLWRFVSVTQLDDDLLLIAEPRSPSDAAADQPPARTQPPS